MLVHELNTPLSVIRMALWEKADHNMINNAINAVQDVNNIIARCSYMEKLDDHKNLLSQTIESFSLLNLIFNERNKTKERNSIILQLPEDDIIISSDPAILSVIISNLFDNAIKYKKQKTYIEVMIEEPNINDTHIQLSIKNTMLDDDRIELAEIFDKFYRSPSANHKTGSGLGLYIINGLVQFLQCQIDVKIVDNCFIVEMYIPLKITEVK